MASASIIHPIAQRSIAITTNISGCILTLLLFDGTGIIDSAQFEI
jgi:hypothetical protein